MAEALVQHCHQGPEKLLSHRSAVPIIDFIPKLAPLKTQNDGHGQLRLHASFYHSTNNSKTDFSFPAVQSSTGGIVVSKAAFQKS